MTSYKVIREFEYRDTIQPVGSVVELEEVIATPFVEAGELEAVETPEEAETSEAEVAEEAAEEAEESEEETPAEEVAEEPAA